MRDVTAKLRRALEDGHFVAIERSIADATEIDGYVVGLGTGWVVLHRTTDDVLLDGYVALRLADITAVLGPEQDLFMAKGLAAMGERPVVPHGLDLDTDHAVIRSFARRFGLIAVHLERDDPEVCHIGGLVAVDRTRLELHEVTPDGEWEQEPEPYEFTDVTRLDAGGRYERALALVAGERP